MGITNVAQFLKETGSLYLRDLLEKAAKKNLRCNNGRTRYVLQGKELEDFNLKYTFGKLKDPKVVIGNNSSKGSSVWGATIYDNADKPIDSYVYSYDITRGREPIIQTRWQKFHDDKKVFTATEYTDLNKKIGNNPDIQRSMVEENGVLKASVSIDDICSCSASSSLSAAEAMTLESQNGIYFQSKDWVEHTINDYSNIKYVRDIMKSLKREFHYRPAKVQTKAKMIEKMDLSAVIKETELQKQKMKQLELELDKLYSEIVGTRTGINAWRKNYVNEKMPEINIKTGEAIQKNDILRLKRKMQRYSDSRNLLMMLSFQKLKLNNYKIYDKKYLTKMIAKYGIKTEDSIDKQLLSELSAIKNLQPFEAMTKAKDIICKHLGLPANLIKISEAPAKYGLEPHTCAFMPQTGEIVYHPTVTSFSTDALISLIRHELDHCEIFAKTAKILGLKDYKNMVCVGNSNAENLFNEEVWSQIIKNIEVGAFDTKYYTEAIKNYKQVKRYNLRQNISYMSNPLEQRAYKAGFDIQHVLNGGNIATETTRTLLASKIFTILEERINKLKSLLGDKMNEYLCVTTLYERAVKSVKDPSSIELELEIYEKMLESIEKGIKKVSKNNIKFPDTDKIKC